MVKRQMMLKVTVVLYLSCKKASLTIPAPASLITDYGVHLTLCTMENGLTAVNYAPFIR